MYGPKGRMVAHPALLESFTATADKIQGPDLQNILRQSYDNAKVTIDLRRMSNLLNILGKA